MIYLLGLLPNVHIVLINCWCKAVVKSKLVSWQTVFRVVQQTWSMCHKLGNSGPCYYYTNRLLYHKTTKIWNVKLLREMPYCLQIYSLVPLSELLSNQSSKWIKPGKMPSRQSFSSARSSMQKKFWSRLNNDYQIRHSRDWRKKTLKLSLPNIHLVSTLRFIKQSWVGSLSCWI